MVELTRIKSDQDVLLEVSNLKVHFPIKRGFLKRVVGHVKAVDGISLYLKKGETLGLVGESGCGKTTSGRAIIRLIKADEGKVYFRSSDDEIVSLHDLVGEELRRLRRQFQIIFQDPFSSLNPRKTVEDIIADPLLVYEMGDRSERREKVVELLRRVGLSEFHLKRFPNEFSGGQRQRIGIARAIALNPSLIVCDEPVSALDVSVQAQILNLLKDIQDESGFSYLFIAHNLSVIYHMCDRVAVMYLGKIVELASGNELYQRPQHPYTEALLSAIPAPDPKLEPRHVLLSGEVPSPLDPPAGCYFHPRCRHATEVCRGEEPQFSMVPGTDEHFVSCHHSERLQLKPALYQHLVGQQQILRPSSP